MITGFTLRSHAIRLTIANLLSCLRLASIPILLFSVAAGGGLGH
jgi:hypothetical protein